MNNLWFQKITITQIPYINVQQILVVTFEFTGAARGLIIISCAARGVRKVGQHCINWFDITVIADAALVNFDMFNKRLLYCIVLHSNRVIKGCPWYHRIVAKHLAVICWDIMLSTGRFNYAKLIFLRPSTFSAIFLIKMTKTISVIFSTMHLNLFTTSNCRTCMAESHWKCQRKLLDCPIPGVIEVTKRMILDVLENNQWIRLDLRKHPDKEPQASNITRWMQDWADAGEPAQSRKETVKDLRYQILRMRDSA